MKFFNSSGLRQFWSKPVMNDWSDEGEIFDQETHFLAQFAADRHVKYTDSGTIIIITICVDYELFEDHLSFYARILVGALV